jgi:hypothetical protein
MTRYIRAAIGATFLWIGKRIIRAGFWVCAIPVEVMWETQPQRQLVFRRKR